MELFNSANLTSDVGEVRYYLKDRETAFVVSEECKPKDLAEKICEIIEKPKEAERIGAAGKLLAFRNFYYKTQGRRLAEFLENVIKLIRKST